MIWRRAARLFQIGVLALPAAAPGLIMLASLALSGAIAPETGFICGAVVLLLTVLVIGRFVFAAAAVRDAVVEMAAAEAAELATRRALGPNRAAEEVRLMVLRLAHAWRERLDGAQARLVAAEAILAAVPDPLILIDQQRRIVGANAAAAEVVGVFASPRDLATALRNPAVLAAADAVLRGEAARVVEFTLTIPTERQLRARFARIAHPSPAAAVALLSLYDVTELKRAEQMRADFIANASHELRTPLATLSGFIETLRGPARDDIEAGDRFLAIMSGQAARMTRLVEDLLSLSRIELNEHVPPQDRLALAPLLDHLAQALELRAGERGMSIRINVPADLPEVLGDRDELAQLFQNLFDNAIKYGRENSEITVSAGSVTQRSARNAQPAGSFVAVAVRDRGDGIAREHLPRLTERFYRVDNARSREMGGTGLGLAIVKHIVGRHRGFLEIDSSLGEGSVFTVYLRRDQLPSPDKCPELARHQIATPSS